MSVNSSVTATFVTPEEESQVIAELDLTFDYDLDFNETPVRVFPLSPENIITSAGASITSKGTVTLTNQDLLFFNKELTTTASLPVENLLSYTWQSPVLDANGNQINPPNLTYDADFKVFRVSKRVIGAVDIEYTTKYKQLAFRHAGAGYLYKTGVLVVYDKGNTARLELTAPTFNLDQAKDLREALYTVTSNYLAETGASPNNQYEVPLNWPDNLTYPEFPAVTAPDEDESAELERTHERGWLTRQGVINRIDRERFFIRNAQPYRGTPTPYSPQYFFFKENPDANVDWDAIIASLQQDYPGLSV